MTKQIPEPKRTCSSRRHVLCYGQKALMLLGVSVFDISVEFVTRGMGALGHYYGRNGGKGLCFENCSKTHKLVLRRVWGRWVASSLVAESTNELYDYYIGYDRQA